MIGHIAFIDFENITSIDSKNVDGKTKVFIMVGKNQTKKSLEYSQTIIDKVSSVELVKIQGQGPNAMDFHIAFYLGKLVDKYNKAKYTIFSNDKGYDPLIKHLTEEGIIIKRIGFKNKIVKEQKAKEEKPVKGENGLYEKTLGILNTGNKRTRPKKKSKLKPYLKTALGNKNTDQEIEQIIERLIKEKAITEEGEKISFKL